MDMFASFSLMNQEWRASAKLIVLLLCLIGLPLGYAQPEFPSSFCSEPNRSAALLVRIQPNYPLQANLLCQEGEVELQFVIETDGRVKDLEIIRSFPEGVFDENTLRAVSRWRFRPQCEGGRAIDQLASQTVEFNLDALMGGQCSEVTNPHAKSLLTDIAGYYRTLSSQIRSTPEEPTNWSTPKLRHQGDLGLVEQFHYDYIKAQMAGQQSFHRLWQLIDSILDAERIESDIDLAQTLSMQRNLRSQFDLVLRQAIESGAEQRIRIKQLRQDVALDDVLWQALIGRFILQPDQSRRILTNAQSVLNQLDEDLASVIDHLDRTRTEWQADPEAPHWARFRIGEHHTEYRWLMDQIRSSRASLTQAQSNTLNPWIHAAD
ncbi:MAG: energy transducer TonB [Pseudomonadota bacterium]